MWFGTRDGLNRFDGYNFTIFKMESKNVKSLSSNFITDLMEDKEGNLWVGTVNGLCRYNPLKEDFERYKINNSSYYIADLFQDSKGIIWIGTNGGLYQFHPKKGITKTFRHDPNNTNSLDDSGINKLTEDKQGNIWIASPQGLDRYNPHTGIFSHFLEVIGKNRKPGMYFVVSVYADSKNRIWVGKNQDGVSVYDSKQNSFTDFRHDPDNPNSLSLDDVLTFAEDGEGRMWIGTQNGGISVVDYEQKLFKNYTLDLNDPKSLGGISIHSLYKDDIENIWVGTWAGGVSMWSRYGDKFASFSKFAGSKTSNVFAITGDEQGIIWLGVEEGGLFSYDPATKVLKRHPNQNEKKFNTNVIFSIKEWNKDTLMLGYHLGSFAFYDKRTGKFTHFFTSDNPNSIFGIVKVSILKDRNNKVWIGDWGGGLNYYDKEKNTFVNYRPNPADVNSLSDGVVFALFEDRQGRLWIGTENGLNEFDRKENRFKRYVHSENDKNSIIHNTVMSIFEDSRANLWIGTGGGLNLFDRKTGKFTAFTEEEGLPNNVINSIQEDRHGNLWLGTNHGLSRFNPIKKVFRNYDIGDGLRGDEFNRNACYKAPDGTMYFGNTSGFNMFNPSDIKNNPSIPPVVLTDLQIFNESVQIGTKDSPLKQSLNHTKEIFLPYDKSVITFHFSALNFISPGKNQYAHQLVGFDKEWNYDKNKRLATYTNLDPATYIFKVKASNNDGIWNYEGTSIKIHILPPFWMTLGFKLGIVALSLSLGLVYYSYRMSRIKRLNLKLQDLVHERTKEIVTQQEEINAQNEELVTANNELHERQEEIASQRDLLAQKNTELSEVRKLIEQQNHTLDQEVKERTKELVEYNQQLEQFAFIAAHNLRAPVARILGLRQLLSLDNISAEEEKMITEKMAQTAEDLDRVVMDINTILEVRKNNTLSKTNINLQEELELIKANLNSEIADTKTEIRENYSGTNVLYTVKPYLDSILFNLISNAIKYRDPKKKPCIEIKTESFNGDVFLKISDNGLGIDLDAHKKNVFTLYKRFHSHVDGKGMGLYLVKTQVEALGGNISVESEVNKGTTFIINFKKQEP
jgi:ligand-binding sensor domain-containing protein/signal transduction histidine kinase